MHPLLYQVQQFVFPTTCLVCTHKLHSEHYFLCYNCLHQLPLTGQYHQHNEVEKIFASRWPFQFGYALLYFQQHNIAQALLHQLKYRGNTDVGEYLGQQLGKVLNTIEGQKHNMMLMPVPLSKKRIHTRGYNQSEIIANAIALETGIPVASKQLLRFRHTATQTHKTRHERYTNMRNAFALANPEYIAGKHIVIIDDVITTGATVESCANQLLSAANVTVSVLAAAVAMH